MCNGRILSCKILIFQLSCAYTQSRWGPFCLWYDLQSWCFAIWSGSFLSYIPWRHNLFLSQLISDSQRRQMLAFGTLLFCCFVASVLESTSSSVSLGLNLPDFSSPALYQVKDSHYEVALNSVIHTVHYLFAYFIYIFYFYIILYRLYCICSVIEPVQIFYKIAHKQSEQSLRMAMWVTKEQNCLHADSEDPDQRTGMCRHEPCASCRKCCAPIQICLSSNNSYPTHQSQIGCSLLLQENIYI